MSNNDKNLNNDKMSNNDKNLNNDKMSNTEIELVRDSYNKIATEFKVTRVFTWKWTDNFIEKLEKDSKLLDIGCGTGRNTNYININITGIDISEEQIKQCNKGNNIVADMCELPFENNSFDNIISIASIQPDKTRRKFEKYGDTVVKWREVPRYYYIFSIPEITDLLKQYFVIISHIWDSGNEIFELEKL